MAKLTKVFRASSGPSGVDFLVIGDGHGCIALIKGLLKQFQTFYVLTDDLAVITFAKSKGLVVVEDLEHWLDQGGELVISSGYRKLVPGHVLSKGIFLNIHYALFPKYRGMHSIVWALLNGEKYVGVTFHVMNENLDAGPIIWQQKLKVRGRTSWELMMTCDGLVEHHASNIIEKFIAGKLGGRAQKEQRATFVGRRNLEDCRIDWDSWDAQYFFRVQKALVKPYPLPFFRYKGQNYALLDFEVIKAEYLEIPGHVVYIMNGLVYIKIKGGLIAVRLLENSAGGAVPAVDIFSRPGARLGSQT